MQRDQTQVASFASSESGQANWFSLVDAIGSARFERVLTEVMSALVAPSGSGAYVRAAFEDLVSGTQPTDSYALSSHWIHFDDGLCKAAIEIWLPERLAPTEASAIRRRVAIMVGALAAIVRKHVETRDWDRQKPEPLASLRKIHQCLLDCTKLTKRESEVCARILYGLSTAGIAVDLDVCETTIKTHRKRAYQRLRIGCERELITWYLRTWGAWSATVSTGETEAPEVTAVPCADRGSVSTYQSSPNLIARSASFATGN